jgi:hypothetical protein
MKDDDLNLAFRELATLTAKKITLFDGWPGDRSGPIHV